MDRRDFLRTTGSVAAIAGTGLWTTSAWAVPRPPGPGDVVKVVHPQMVTGQFPDPAIARDMVFTAVKRLTGEDDPGRAFGHFVGPNDKVGVKVNCLAGRHSSTSREVAYAIVEGVRLAGVPDDKIAIFDQYPWALLQGRYLRDVERPVRTIHHDEVPNAFTEETRIHGCRFRWAKNFLAFDKVINVPIIKDHNLSGVTCAIKNVVCGVIDLPPRLHRVIHEAMPRVWASDEIRSRVSLTVCDAGVIQYSNGPKVALEFRKPMNTVYATTDPIAMDAIARDLVEAARAEHRLPPLARQNRAPRFVEVGASLGLGIADPAQMRVEEVTLGAPG
jgi:uncharacterized protein (DUF362 family)